MERSMNKIKYSDLDKWNDYFIGSILDDYADEIKNAILHEYRYSFTGYFRGLQRT